MFRDDMQAFYAREDRRERVLYWVANAMLLVLVGVGVWAVWLAIR